MPSEYEKKQQVTATYQPSQLVQQKQSALNQVEAQKPSAYTSNYGADMENLYKQSMNRKPFQYDINGDALYQQYAQNYQQQGQQAMMDTMGQAAALTGGYGNSYAATAGNQAYQGYLTQLNNMVPQLAQLAQERYNQEGQTLKDLYGMAQGADQLDYARYQDALANWQNERDYANQQYAAEYSRDYQATQDAQSQANWQANYDYTKNKDEQSQANWQANYDYTKNKDERDYERDVYEYEKNYASNWAMTMIENGQLPSKELLEAAGIKGEDAQAYIDAYHKGEASTSSTTSTTNNNKNKTDDNAGNKNNLYQNTTPGEALSKELKKKLAMKG